MKLYFKPGACSLAPHIVAREANLDLTLEKVDTKAQRTETGADYRAINPKGYVPAVRLDDGQVLTEVAVLVQYLADRKPEANLIARAQLEDPKLKSRVPEGVLPALKRQFYDAVQVTGPEAFGALMSLFGPEHILLGTDVPYVDAEDTVGGIADLNLDPAALKSIRRDNALGLLPRFRA